MTHGLQPCAVQVKGCLKNKQKSHNIQFIPSHFTLPWIDSFTKSQVWILPREVSGSLTILYSCYLKTRQCVLTALVGWSYFRGKFNTEVAILWEFSVSTTHLQDLSSIASNLPLLLSTSPGHSPKRVITWTSILFRPIQCRGPHLGGTWYSHMMWSHEVKGVGLVIVGVDLSHDLHQGFNEGGWVEISTIHTLNFVCFIHFEFTPEVGM